MFFLSCMFIPCAAAFLWRIGYIKYETRNIERNDEIIRNIQE